MTNEEIKQLALECGFGIMEVAPYAIFQDKFRLLVDAVIANKTVSAYQRGYLDGKSNTQLELTTRQLSSACLTMRHDFGLMSDKQKETMLFIAEEWLKAFNKEVD